MKKGDFEVNEMFVVFLIIVGIVAAAVILQVSTNSVGEILEDSIDVLDAKFYKETPNGEFRIYTYKWSLDGLDKVPDETPYNTDMTVPDYPTLLNKRFPIDLRGALIRVFKRQDETAPDNIKIALIQLGNSSLSEEWGLDESNFNMSFYDYRHERQLVENCHVYNSTYDVTTKGTDYGLFYISCKFMWAR